MVSNNFLSRYEAAVPDYNSYRKKDGALLAIGALCDKLKQKEPYKSDLEAMLVQHVFPEFSSPIGHLRAKVCSVTTYFFIVSILYSRICYFIILSLCLVEA